MKYNWLALVAFSALMPLFSCKEVQNSSGNPVPRIQLIRVEPLTVKQFSDTLKITLAYEDGDGDLGFENADINSLEVQDERLDKPDYYYLPPQAPVDASIRIKGQLTMKLRSLFLLGSGNTETTVLSIRVRDRAGNYSNTIKTQEITITR